MTTLDPTSPDPTWRDYRNHEGPDIDSALAHENTIIWTEDITGLDYVRQTVAPTRNRKGHALCPAPTIGRTIGYAELVPNLGRNRNHGPDGGFLRRVFWVKNYDRSENPGGIYAADCPTEAVDPRTVAPGQAGYVTIRARQGGHPHPIPPSIARVKGCTCDGVALHAIKCALMGLSASQMQAAIADAQQRSADWVAKLTGRGNPTTFRPEARAQVQAGPR